MVKILKPHDLNKDEFVDFLSNQKDMTQRHIYRDVCKNVALYATIAQKFEQSDDAMVTNLYDAGVDKLHKKLGTLTFNLLECEYTDIEKFSALYYKALDSKAVLYPIARIFDFVPEDNKAYNNEAFENLIREEDEESNEDDYLQPV